MNKKIFGSRLRGPARWKSAKTLKAARDAARGRNWPEAAASYRDYLDKVPADAPTWVQYGHALKEAELLAEAEEAYARAIKLDPADDDAPVHLAHLLKRLGPERSREAADMFAAIARATPTAESLDELLITGNGVDIASLLEDRPAGLPANAICLELKDLFQYLSLHTTVTGITRVTLSLVNYILYEMDPAAAARYQFVHQYGDGSGVMLVTKEYMRRIVRGAMHDTPDLTMMQDLIGEIRRKSSVFRLAAGDTYLIVGAFWEFVANPSWLASMRYRGVAVGCYIYDLIPITYAQYCMQALTDAFTLAFSETARLLSFAMTISGFVADEVTAYLDAHEIPRFPVEPVLLAHELRFEDRSARRVPRRRERTYVTDIPFVLCVCTIEARKNHVYLFSIWQRMIEAGIAVPDLVFVGRPGWRVDELMADIESSNYLDGRLHILNGLSDDELASLYDQCLFTAFPSFVEGWGLPVGESLAHRKVCVASSTSSVPEVGGEHAVYVDPFDPDAGYAVISDLIANPGKIAAMEADLRRSFKPRTWNDVGRDFFAATERLLAGLEPGLARRDLFAPRLPETKIYDTARIEKAAARGGRYVTNPDRLAFVSGWRGVEAAGTWMLDHAAELRVLTDCGPFRDVSIVLHAGASPWVNFFNVLSVFVLDGAAGEGSEPKPDYRRPLQKGSDFWLTLNGRTDEAGFLTIRFEISGSIRTPEGLHAPVAFRLRAVGYAQVDNLHSRIELLERALLS